MTDLSGKTAIVTGASGGIGQAVARALSEAGAQVAVCGQNPERLEQAAAEVRKGRGEALVVAADLRNNDGIQQTIDTVTPTAMTGSTGTGQVFPGRSDTPLAGIPTRRAANAGIHTRTAAVSHVKSGVSADTRTPK